MSGLDRLANGIITVITRASGPRTEDDLRRAGVLLAPGLRPAILAGAPVGLQGLSATRGNNQSTFVVGTPTAIVGGPEGASQQQALQNLHGPSVRITDALASIERFCEALDWDIEMVALQFYRGTPIAIG